MVGYHEGTCGSVSVFQPQTRTFPSHSLSEPLYTKQLGKQAMILLLFIVILWWRTVIQFSLPIMIRQPPVHYLYLQILGNQTASCVHSQRLPAVPLLPTLLTDGLPMTGDIWIPDPCNCLGLIPPPNDRLRLKPLSFDLIGVPGAELGCEDGLY